MPCNRFLTAPKEATKSHYNAHSLYDIIIIAKKIRNGLMGAIPWGFSHAPKEVFPMGYRKVSYLEQVWYILLFKIKHPRRKEDNRAK